MRIARAVAFLLLTGYITGYFSEWAFWSGRPSWDVIQGFPYTLLLYSFITWLFLAVVHHFRVRTVWALFLAGAIYGWLLEGVIVQTTYDDFPLNISFTALAWHAPITILFGWYALPQWMTSAPRRFRQASAGFGLFLGLWSIGWWMEAPVAPVWIVFLYSAGFTLLLMAAYLMRSRWGVVQWYSKGSILVGLALLLIYFVVVTIPAQPMALYLLPPLMAVTLLALHHNRRIESVTPDNVTPPDNFVTTHSAPFTFTQSLPLLLIPLAASTIYGLAYALHLVLPTLVLPTLQIAFFILMPLGFILFGVSLDQVARRRVF